MDVIVNKVKDVGNSTGKHPKEFVREFGNTAKGGKLKELMSLMGKNIICNIDHGSKQCPLMNTSI